LVKWHFANICEVKLGIVWQFWWGEFSRQVYEQQENGLANYGQKPLNLFDMVSIIIHCVTKYKVSIILIIILNSIFKNISGAKNQSSPLTLKP
jgi:hypothetical protein